MLFYARKNLKVSLFLPSCPAIIGGVSASWVAGPAWRNRPQVDEANAWRWRSCLTCPSRRNSHSPGRGMMGNFYNLMDAALPLQTLDGFAHLVPAQSVRPPVSAPGFSGGQPLRASPLSCPRPEAAGRTSRFDRFILPPIANQQHAVIGMQTTHKLVHLSGGRK